MKSIENRTEKKNGGMAVKQHLSYPKRLFLTVPKKNCFIEFPVSSFQSILMSGFPIRNERSDKCLKFANIKARIYLLLLVNLEA